MMVLNLETATQTIVKKLNQYSKIVLFVHEAPDCDAIGSAFSMQNFINLNFKDKDVRIAGLTDTEINSLPEFFKDAKATVDADFCHNALGIVFDVANQERVLSHLNHACSETIRIDHHIKVQEFCDYEYVDDSKSSTCEMMGLFYRLSGLAVNEIILESLYFGLLTDTNRFLYDHTTTSTYDLMTWMSQNKFDKELVHNQLYLKDIREAKLDNKLFKKIKFKDGYATLFLRKWDNYWLKQKTFSSKVYLMAGFKDVQIWTLVYYDENLKTWKGSIRSREYPVNQIAQCFNGGGHRLASGFKLKEFSETKEVEAKIVEMLKEGKNEKLN